MALVDLAKRSWMAWLVWGRAWVVEGVREVSEHGFTVIDQECWDPSNETSLPPCRA